MIVEFLLAAVLMTAPPPPQPRVIATQTVTVSSPSFWRKVARVATFGIVQPPPPQQVQANKAFSVLADHNPNEVGAETVGYQLFINGSAVRSGTVAQVWTAGVVTFSGVTLAKGTYTIEMTAYNEAGDARSAPIAVVSQPGKPKEPTNLRTQSGGGQ